MNGASSVEQLLAQVDHVDPGRGPASFELWVPNSLTFRGSLIRQDVAMAIVLDRILAKGFFPDGFVEESSGRRYTYRVLTT